MKSGQQRRKIITVSLNNHVLYSSQVTFYLIDLDDIVFWRTNYIDFIRKYKYGTESKEKYYLNET